MIGQAGTGSPEAGIVLRVDPRVLVYTLRTERRPDAQGAQNRVGSPVRSISPWYLFCMVAKQVSLCRESDSLSRLIQPLHSGQKCVQLFGDFCGTAALMAPGQARAHKCGWK